MSARGARPNTKFIESLEGALTASGTVKVTPTLQVVGHPRIFAGGDAIDWQEQKQATKAGNHAVVIAQNILSLLSLTKKALIPYKGSPEIIIITNGKVCFYGHPHQNAYAVADFIPLFRTEVQGISASSGGLP